MDWTAAPQEMRGKSHMPTHSRWIFPVLLLSALWFSMPQPAPASFWPEISPEEALKIADRYVRQKQIDLSGQYIHLLRLDYDPGVKRQGLYWRMHWKWASPKMGGEYGLRIYMDKTVLEEIAGP